MNIAFFDFDGTITRQDSLFLFLKFLFGKKVFYWGMLKNLHYLCGYALGMIHNNRAKERLIGYFMAGINEKELLEKCKDFVLVLEKICRDDAIKRIKWHQDRGDRVVVVSATFGCYLGEWCKARGLEYLCTELESIDGVLSGRFATPNCYGAQKVERIMQSYRLDVYKEIYAYGDSKGDQEMLQLASKGFYRLFNQ